LAHEAWEARDRKVSPDLLARIEREIFQRARAGLEPAAERFLRRLAVFRHPIEPQAMARLLDPGQDLGRLRAELIDRFIIELHRERYAMPSLLRDAVHAQLSEEPRRQAHRMAGDWFAPHFRAQKVLGSAEKLGGAFVEARYHLVHAGDEQGLREVGQWFEAHVRATMGFTSPLPQDPAETDERIAFLSALLSEGNGAKCLHSYLAKLLAHRRRAGDLERAVGPCSQGDGSPVAQRGLGAVYPIGGRAIWGRGHH